MAKKKIITTKKTSSIKPTISRTSQSLEVNNTEMIFTKTTYLWMLAGAAIIAVGMALMISPRPADPNIWDESIMYGFRPTVLAPMVILAGLGLEIYAIFKK